jgi:hypothetical protein
MLTAPPTAPLASIGDTSTPTELLLMKLKTADAPPVAE